MSVVDNLLGDGPTVLVTAVGAAEGARAAAAALACAGADAERAALLVDVGGRPPRPTLLATARGADAGGAARGAPAPGPGRCPRPDLPRRRRHRSRGSGGRGRGGHRRPWLPGCRPPAAGPVAAGVGGGAWAATRRRCCCVPTLPRDRALLALVARDLRARGLRGGSAQVRGSPWVAERRALFGAWQGVAGCRDGCSGSCASPALLRHRIRVRAG